MLKSKKVSAYSYLDFDISQKEIWIILLSLVWIELPLWLCQVNANFLKLFHCVIYAACLHFYLRKFKEICKVLIKLICRYQMAICFILMQIINIKLVFIYFIEVALQIMLKSICFLIKKNGFYLLMQNSV